MLLNLLSVGGERAASLRWTLYHEENTVDRGKSNAALKDLQTGNRKKISRISTLSVAILLSMVFRLSNRDIPEYHHYHHHPVVCLTTGSKPLPKRSLHILRSRASSFKLQYPLLSLRSSSIFLRLLQRNL